MIPVYRGVPRQYGQGLGSLFKSIVKTVRPLVTPVIKTAVKSLGREGLKRGISAASDILDGQPVKQVMKRAAINTLKSAGKTTLASIQPRIKKKTSPRKPHSTSRHHRDRHVSKRRLDIFD